MSEEDVIVEATEDDAVEVDHEAAVSARRELERRCSQVGIAVEERKEPFEGGTKFLVLQFPCGRDKRPYVIWGVSEIEKLLSVPFEDYVFLTGFEAICSYKHGTIESLATSLVPMPPSFIERLLLGRRGPTADEEEGLNLELQYDPSKAIKLRLYPTSEVLKVLSGRRARSSLSFVITGLSVSRHDEAVHTLKQLSNALFFQLDLMFGVSLNLTRERRAPLYRRRARRSGVSIDDISFPKDEYDEAPMSLYWYARSARGMPLLQFLAYYQAIEFYFPTYFQAEATRKIRKILKDPSFRPEKDADIGRVLSALTSCGGSLGGERSMIRATIQECVDPDELRAFLTSDDNMLEFFSSKTKGLTSHKLPIANTSTDLRGDVADRIYDIRCKIVHTKTDSRDAEMELLLPFSKEAELLYYDIELIQYVAQQVLITASTPLQLG